MCQGPEQARILPTGTRFTSGAVAWARGRAGWFQLCKEGIGKKDRKKKKKSKLERKKQSACSLFDSVPLGVSLSLAFSPMLTRSLSRPRAPLFCTSHPAGRLTPPTPAFMPPAARRGTVAERPPPKTPRGQMQASPRGPPGSRSRRRATRSSRGHLRALGAAKVRTGGRGRGRPWRL